MIARSERFSMIVRCPHCHSRNEIPRGVQLAHVRCWNCGAKLVRPNAVEPTTGGALVGAAIGAMFGGTGGAALGAILGAALGAAAGGQQQ